MYDDSSTQCGVSSSGLCPKPPPGMKEFGMTPPKSLIPVCSPCAAPMRAELTSPPCTHSPHHSPGAQPHMETHTELTQPCCNADPVGTAVPLHLPTAQFWSGPHPDGAGHVPCVSQRPTAPYAKGEVWGGGMGCYGVGSFVPVLCAQPGGELATAQQGEPEAAVGRPSPVPITVAIRVPGTTISVSPSMSPFGARVPPVSDPVIVPVWDQGSPFPVLIAVPMWGCGSAIPFRG